MKYVKLLCFVFIIYSVTIFPQSYSGPSTGTVNSGVEVSTDGFLSVPGDYDPTAEKHVKPYMEFYAEPDFDNRNMEVLENYVYIEDANASLGENSNEAGTSFELHSFNSIPMQNSVPPDPHVAVGPNHVIAVVNSRFYIYDRDGNLLKDISGDAWCSEVVPNPGAFDPQIIYDHFEGRWVMVWDSQNQQLTGYHIISYSDDDNPIGTWYMYALDATYNGSIQSNPLNWGDFPQLGYDDLGIYISSRQFYFAGGFAGAKIRILNKSELYAATGGPLSFTDLWDIRLLNGGDTDDLHPTISYDAGNNTAYFVIIPNGGVEISLYKITDPINSPVLSGVDVDVTDFNTAPLARQLGGSDLIDTGQNASGIRNSPIIRDDSLYAVHHIWNTQFPGSGSIRFYVIDVNTESVVHEMELGADGFHYYYPAVAVDQDHNVAITYTRSGVTEYAGSYYSTKLVGESELSPSKVMTEGKGYYYVAPGGGRNRWGDYLGAALDPVNQYNIWLYSEYAAATNTYGTWLTEIRMVPFTGVYGYLSSDSLAFGNVEINAVSDTLEVVIANYGTSDLEISDIASDAGPFARTSTHTFPLTLPAYDSVTVKVIFAPTDPNDYDETLSITSNDPGLTGIKLTGHSYEIIEPFSGIFYASSGPGNNGDIINIDMTTGVGTTVGPSLYSEVTSLSVNQSSNILYGLVPGINSEIVRVNADQGDSYTLHAVAIPILSGIAFDTSGTLYASHTNGEIYSIDLTTGSFALETTTSIELNAIAFHPETNVLWAAITKGFGAGKDSLYTVDLTTGDVTPVGVTGFNIVTNDLAFDADNKLYGVTGTSNQEGKIFEISQVDGSGTLIGTGIGFNHTVGLAYSLNGPIVSVDGEDAIPKEFALKQNYPNPFNPITKIEFSLPVASEVELVIYNILGQQITTLINEQRNAGNHSVIWNATDSYGNKLSSGIYLYSVNATGNNGSKFQETRKMVLLK